MDGQERSRVFTSNAAMFAYLHGQEEAGHEVRILSRRRALEVDARSLLIEYHEHHPREVRVPAAEIVWRSEASSLRGLVEATFVLLEELRRAGITLDDASLSSALRSLGQRLFQATGEEWPEDDDRALLAVALVDVTRLPRMASEPLELRLAFRCTTE